MRWLILMSIAVLLAGCSASNPASPAPRDPGHRGLTRSAAVSSRLSPDARSTPGPSTATAPQALVTAETQNRLIAVDPRSGRVERSVPMPTDPEFVAATSSRAVVVSPASAVVTLLRRPDLRTLRVMRGFQSPHIDEIAPGGRYAYVTDDASGELTVIRLEDGAVVDRLLVGAGAHHFDFAPDGKEAWVALGESARTIVVLDTLRLTRPRVVGRFDPGYAVHDVRFAPDGRAWLTSSDSSEVGVWDPATRRLLFRVPGGEAPQHVVFAHGRAYVASGYGDRIEAVNSRSGRVLTAARSPHGSFNLEASGGLVATASLLRGTLTVLAPDLRRLRTVRLAPETRDVALSVPVAR